MFHQSFVHLKFELPNSTWSQESSQTSAGEASKYKGLAIKEASSESIPDLFDYENTYLPWSFLNSDNIRRNSGYIQIVWDSYSEWKKRNSRGVKERKFPEGKKKTDKRNARENKFHCKNQVGLWGVHVCILKTRLAQSISCEVVLNSAVDTEIKRGKTSSLAFSGGRKTSFPKRPCILKRHWHQNRQCFKVLDMSAVGACRKMLTTISYNLSWFFSSISRRHFQAIKLSCKHQKNNSW